MKNVATRLSFMLRAKGIRREEFYAVFPGSKRIAIDTIDAHREPKEKERLTIEQWLTDSGIKPWGCWDIVKSIEPTGARAIERNADRKYLVNQIKDLLGFSWREIHKETGVPASTLCTWTQTENGSMKRKYYEPVDAFIDAHLEDAREKANSLKWENIKIKTISKRSNTMRRSPEFLTDKILEFYGMNEDPFTAGIETEQDIWLSPSLKYAMEIIEQGVNRRKGILAFHGKSGSGKTVLAKLAMMRLKKLNNTQIVFLSDVNLEKLSPAEFLREVYREICPGKPVYYSAQKIQRELVKELANMWDHGQQLAVMIDEAHALSYPLLKGLKRFIEVMNKDSRFGFYGCPVLVVLFGHDELKFKLEGANMEEVKGRVYMTEMTLSGRHVPKYLEHRTRASFMKDNGIWDILEKEALYAMSSELKTPTGKHDDARITPLDVNIAMSRALKLGYRQKEAVITQKVMIESLRQF